MRSAVALPQDWQTLYAAAMLESDSTRVRQRIDKADEAIRARLRELPETFAAGSEQAELHYALTYLARLNHESVFHSKSLLGQETRPNKLLASDARL